MQQERSLLTIDVAQVLHNRLGARRMSRVPGFVVRWLERFICQDRLNELLRGAWPATGADFCASVLGQLGVTYTVENAGRLPDQSRPGDCRVLYVSNHPLGGLDGMILIDMISRRALPQGASVSVIVNDLLAAVEPLGDVFVPVNKHGRQSRGAASRVEEVFEGSGPVVMFPAGLCSRRGPGGEVCDPDWNAMFVKRAIRSGRDIIPLHFIGQNSSFFYRFASLRKRMGIKFNIEMIRLPAELTGAGGRSYTIRVGERIPAESLAAMGSPAEAAAHIRNLTYSI